MKHPSTIGRFLFNFKTRIASISINRLPCEVRRSQVKTLKLFLILGVYLLSHGISALAQIDTCLPPPTAMVSWWPGDNTPDDIVSAHNGTLQGGATYTTPALGKVGPAFSVAAADFVNVTDPPDGSLDFGTGPFSIDAWIKTTSTGAATIVDKRELPGGNPVGYSLAVVSGKLTFQLGDGGTFVGNKVGVHSDINDDNWHHVAVTVKNRAAGGGNLYVDGVNVLPNFSTALTAGGNISNAGALRIGQRQTFSTPEAFAGAIDEVEIFNRELDSTEVQSIWIAGSACIGSAESRHGKVCRYARETTTVLS
jgi:hypothetical protein